MEKFRKAATAAEKTSEQESAWIGDAVLELFTRNWILKHHGTLSGELAKRMTSNQFLATLGNPDAIEAHIGRIYADEGLDSAFRWMEAEILPHFQKQEKNRR